MCKWADVLSNNLSLKIDSVDHFRRIGLMTESEFYELLQRNEGKTLEK